MPEIRDRPAARSGTSPTPQVDVELDTGDMILNLGPAAPGHARHAAPRRAPRRRARRRGRPGHRLHAPRLREAHRVPHVPADHHADQPHRLAVELRQRGAVHRRAPSSSWASRRRRAREYIRTILTELSPHRHLLPVPRRDGSAGRRAHARVLRLPRPRARAQPHRGRDRRSLPPQLQPHRRPEGRPALGLDRRDAAR